MVGQTRVHVDEVESLGNFMELEVSGAPKYFNPLLSSGLFYPQLLDWFIRHLQNVRFSLFYFSLIGSSQLSWFSS